MSEQSDVNDIRRTLATLPGRCKYHGANIWDESTHAVWSREGACRDMGVSSVRRKRAEDALARLAAAGGDGDAR